MSEALENVGARASLAQVQTHYIAVDATEKLTNAYPNAGADLANFTTLSADTLYLPNADDELVYLHLRMTAIAGGATSITWFIAYDSAGDYIITDAITTNIVFKPSDATIGCAAAKVSLPFRRFFDGAGAAIGTSGHLYVFGKLNAGTATGTYRAEFKASWPTPSAPHTPVP